MVSYYKNHRRMWLNIHVSDGLLISVSNEAISIYDKTVWLIKALSVYFFSKQIHETFIILSYKKRKSYRFHEIT